MPILIFDGVCNLCNGLIDFIIRRNESITFCAGQSPKGDDLLKKHNIKDFESIILLEDGKVYQKSAAILRVFKKLGALWSLLYIFMIVPPFFRDSIYKFIARNRYGWFGKQNECRVPDKDEQKRFC